MRLVSVMHHVLSSDHHAFRARGYAPRPYNLFRHITWCGLPVMEHALCFVIDATNVKNAIDLHQMTFSLSADSGNDPVL